MTYVSHNYRKLYKMLSRRGHNASWKVDDVDKIEKTDGSVTYVIEVESGEKEYELTYLEDGTLIREDD